MNSMLRGLVRAVAETFHLPGPILEVGSYQVAGQEPIADLRSLFPGRPYTGLDRRDGPGVDVIGDVECLPYPDGSFGTVLALGTFEHVGRFWRGFEEIHRVLRPDGAFLVACPFYFHIHAHPDDYWRFTPAALELLLEDYPGKIIGWHGPPARPANVWALAFREERPPISSAEFAVYQDRMHEHARMPLSWRRRLRYHLGRFLCGRGPFAPYLDREQWQSRCINQHRPSRVASCMPACAVAARCQTTPMGPPLSLVTPP
jgi:SAM-dependent methyltransferase